VAVSTRAVDTFWADFLGQFCRDGAEPVGDRSPGRSGEVKIVGILQA
jgi:hypothetical protein